MQTEEGRRREELFLKLGFYIRTQGDLKGRVSKGRVRILTVSETLGVLSLVVIIITITDAPSHLQASGKREKIGLELSHTHTPPHSVNEGFVGNVCKASLASTMCP